MPPLQRTLTRSPSTPLLLPSSSSARPVLAPSASSARVNFPVLSPLEVAHIAYFPVSASGSPKRGMNTHVRFVRPGHPSASLDVQPAHTGLTPSASQAGEPPSFERFQFAALQDRRNPTLPKQPRSRTRLVLKDLKGRTSSFSRKLGLAVARSARPRASRVPSDPEFAFQDEQHRKHVCWHCRKAGGRQMACRAFKRAPAVSQPVSSLSDTPLVIVASMS